MSSSVEKSSKVDGESQFIFSRSDNSVNFSVCDIGNSKTLRDDFVDQVSALGFFTWSWISLVEGGELSSKVLGSMSRIDQDVRVPKVVFA